MKLITKLAEVTVDPSTGKVSGGQGFFGGNFTDIFSKATSVLIYAVGIISVIMVIVGGLMYTLSAGEPANTKKAKDTILYAVIGLVIALVALSIVTYVRNIVK